MRTAIDRRTALRFAAAATCTRAGRDKPYCERLLWRTAGGSHSELSVSRHEPARRAVGEVTANACETGERKQKHDHDGTHRH